jgi:hypothetical protein
MSEPNLDHPGPFPALLESLVEDRVAKTLDRLLTSHRNATITAQEALSGIAMIAALRSLPSDLAQRIRQAK